MTITVICQSKHAESLPAQCAEVDPVTVNSQSLHGDSRPQEVESPSQMTDASQELEMSGNDWHRHN